MSYTYKYPRPAVTVDIILFDNQEPAQLLLIRRKNPPFQGQWAFPGGFVDPDETLEHAAQRELAEETGLNVGILQQFKTYSAPDRDPRGRTISTVFYANVGNETIRNTTAGDDAESAGWFPVNQLPELAFDHEKIVNEALAANIFRVLR